MSRTRLIPVLLMSLAAMPAAMPALAMDLPPEVMLAQEAGTVSIGKGWYIRGDFGYSGLVDTTGRPTYDVYNAGTDSTTTNGFDRARMSGDFSVSAGMGYQFNDYLRTDLTVDWFTGQFNGRSDWETPCALPSGSATASCRYTGAEFGALGLLANAYVDLGTYWGITPYVGGGAGMANVKWGDVNQRIRCSAADPGDCSGLDTASTVHAGIDSWRFAYALMAGASYDLTNHTKLDFGYRYSRINGGDMFGYSAYEQFIGAFGTKGRDKGINRHEFRAGLRLTTW